PAEIEFGGFTAQTSRPARIRCVYRAAVIGAKLARKPEQQKLRLPPLCSFARTLNERAPVFVGDMGADQPEQIATALLDGLSTTLRPLGVQFLFVLLNQFAKIVARQISVRQT